mgnify:CR=1 FL=1|jgi:ferredoxin
MFIFLNMITIIINNNSGGRKALRIPDNKNSSLMEVLKGAGHGIAATCGGIALCGTCLVQILNGTKSLSPPAGQELDTLAMLPNVAGDSRLACQLRLNAGMNGLH